MCLLSPRCPRQRGEYSALSDDTCPAQVLYFESGYFHNHSDHHLILSSFFFAVDLPFSLPGEVSLRPGDLANVFLLSFHQLKLLLSEQVPSPAAGKRASLHFRFSGNCLDWRSVCRCLLFWTVHSRWQRAWLPYLCIFSMHTVGCLSICWDKWKQSGWSLCLQAFPSLVEGLSWNKFWPNCLAWQGICRDPALGVALVFSLLIL